MTLHVHTARISSRDPDRLDITRKSAGPDGLPFAPSAPLLRAAKSGALSFSDYEPRYIEEMRASWRTQRPAWLVATHLTLELDARERDEAQRALDHEARASGRAACVRKAVAGVRVGSGRGAATARLWIVGAHTVSSSGAGAAAGASQRTPSIASARRG